MRKLYVTLALSGFSLISFSQSITWSSEEVKPKEKNLFTNLAFPGADANNYYVNESEAGGVTFRNRKFKDYITVVDKNTLKVKTQVDLNAAFKDNDGDYLNAENFFFKDRKYYFFINRDNKEKNVYDVYCSIQQLEGDSPGELKVIQKVDRKKDKPFKDNYDPFADKEKEEGAAFSAAMYVNIKPAYDGNSIISAMVTETVDDNYSTLNLSEWDKDMKSIHSNNYKIPFLRRTIGTRSSMSNMGRLGEKPRVRDFAKDNNGFIYVLVYSADPKSPELRSQYYICQFKLSDPAYMKIYKNEINKNIASAGIGLHQDESGKLFFSNLGVEIEDEKDEKNYMWVNSAIIGSFNSQGEFVSIYTNRLSEEMMYHFEKEKKVNKEGKLETLNIVNILSGSDGGCYVIWQYHWTETANSGHAADTHYENALVQCYDNNNKMKWEKVIYKNQQSKTSVPGYYCGLSSFMLDGALYVVWPDDPSNEKRTVDDNDPAKYSVVKFGNKDLAGIFVAKFSNKGDYTRKYMHWPEERMGYAFCNFSLKRTEKKEFIGTARIIHQGVALLKSEEYSFFKLSF